VLFNDAVQCKDSTASMITRMSVEGYWNDIDSGNVSTVSEELLRKCWILKSMKVCFVMGVGEMLQHI